MKKTLFGVVVLAIALVMGTMMSCSKEEEAPAMTVEQLNDTIANLVDDTVTFEGTIEGFCCCKGMKLVGAEFGCMSETLDTTMTGDVRVNGIVREKRITAEEIDTLVARMQAKAIEDSIAAATAPVVAEAPAAPAEEAAPAEGCCAEKAEGEKCCGKCEMTLEKALEMKAECAENGLGYLVLGYYVEVISIEPVVAEEAAE